MFVKLCTKDNFWNLMFLVGIVISSSLAEFFAAPWIFWCSIFVVGYITKKAQNLSVKADKEFVNSQGQLLNDRYPIFVTFAVLGSTLFFVLYGATTDILNIKPDAVPFCLDVGILFLPFILYFIKINCPISILFHTSSWRAEITGWRIDSNSSRTKQNFLDSHNIHKPSPLQSFMLENPITDPRWSGSSSNIFNNSRR